MYGVLAEQTGKMMWTQEVLHACTAQETEDLNVVPFNAIFWLRLIFVETGKVCSAATWGEARVIGNDLLNRESPLEAKSSAAQTLSRDVTRNFAASPCFSRLLENVVLWLRAKQQRQFFDNREWPHWRRLSSCTRTQDLATSIHLYREIIILLHIIHFACRCSGTSRNFSCSTAWSKQTTLVMVQIHFL